MSASIPPEEQERLARELAEQLRQLRVEDVVVNALMTISSIGYRRLGVTDDTRQDRDLEQTRLAIETMRALTPVLERFIPGELARDFNASVANLQLAYAKAATASGEDTPGGRTPDAKAATASGEDTPSGQTPGAKAATPSGEDTPGGQTLDAAESDDGES